MENKTKPQVAMAIISKYLSGRKSIPLYTLFFAGFLIGYSIAIQICNMDYAFGFKLLLVLIILMALWILINLVFLGKMCPVHTLVKYELPDKKEGCIEIQGITLRTVLKKELNFKTRLNKRIEEETRNIINRKVNKYPKAAELLANHFMLRTNNAASSCAVVYSKNGEMTSETRMLIDSIYAELEKSMPEIDFVKILY